MFSVLFENRYFFLRLSLPYTLTNAVKRSQKRTFSIALSRVEIFENVGFSFTCGWTRTVSNSQYHDVIHHTLLA